jgi:hypothetical protein
MLYNFYASAEFVVFVDDSLDEHTSRGAWFERFLQSLFDLFDEQYSKAYYHATPDGDGRNDEQVNRMAIEEKDQDGYDQCTAQNPTHDYCEK